MRISQFLSRVLSLTICFLIFSPIAYGARYDTVYRNSIFKEQPIVFNPKIHSEAYALKDGVIYLGNGRVVLKKINIPSFKRDSKVYIKIKLQSNGDPWDKSGSCFVLPRTSDINMIKVIQNTSKYPIIDSNKLEKFVGIVPGKGFEPVVELMRFMTPFGAGAFTPKDSLLAEKRTPVYIDGFAPYVEWNQEITDRLPLLRGEVYVGAFIDTWTEKGYKISVELMISQSNIKSDHQKKTYLKSLINTVYYPGQSIPDLFARKSVEIPFTIPINAKNVRLHYITSGHGGHEGGDEFVQCRNIISLNGNEIYNFIPWRNDCASFRRYNPSTGVWLKKRNVAYISDEGKRVEKVVEEPIASSDLSRSNWCPGSDVPPVTIPLGKISKTSNILKIAIPQAQPAKDNALNHWLISAWITWE